MSVVVAAVIVVVAVVVALVIRSRGAVDAPTQRSYSAPTQIDTADFIDADVIDADVGGAEWLVVVFTSHTCHVCADVAAKARVLESRSVAVREVEYAADRRLHERYNIDAVPTLVICDAQGVVRKSILGPVSATDLWVAVADVRDPSAQAEPRHCANHDH